MFRCCCCGLDCCRPDRPDTIPWEIPAVVVVVVSLDDEGFVETATISCFRSRYTTMYEISIKQKKRPTSNNVQSSEPDSFNSWEAVLVDVVEVPDLPKRRTGAGR